MIDKIISKSSYFNQKDKESIKEKGVVFTNRYICDIIINKIKPKITEIICEPSVGKGVFIFSLLEYFRVNNTIEQLANFVNNNLYCYDINNEFLSEFKKLLTEYFKYFGFNDKLVFDNIKCEDFLNQDVRYDVILGNPPYVRIQNINKDYLNKLKSELKSISLGNIDLYYAFLEKSLLVSKRVGFIIPNSFIKNKSGYFIRNLIKDRLSYIYDFKVDKVWNNISTYTSIIICDDIYSDEVLYESKDSSILKNKKDLSSDKWIFGNIKIGSNRLIDMVNYVSVGLATLKDNIFKMDTYDENYCYKGNFKIEKDICKKYIKASKCKKFDDFQYIIYPYVDGKLINEDKFKYKYPLCYKYLLNNKAILLLRDGGKISNDRWYSYGRSQGLLKDKKGVRIILPLTFLKSKKIHYIEIPEDDECLVLSGIFIDIKKDMKNKFIDIIMDNNFHEFCELTNKNLSDSDLNDVWLTLSTTTIKTYNY